MVDMLGVPVQIIVLTHYLSCNAKFPVESFRGVKILIQQNIIMITHHQSHKRFLFKALEVLHSDSDKCQRVDVITVQRIIVSSIMIFIEYHCVCCVRFSWDKQTKTVV